MVDLHKEFLSKYMRLRMMYKDLLPVSVLVIPFRDTDTECKFITYATKLNVHVTNSCTEVKVLSCIR